ncbi:flagellar hook-associated protein FlgK [Sulfitobacter sp.]|uniref:flagellar hook-associated protein FlgK n=1 Tax=Sulfitobacter sp. TaxID=1903071 RepID=UPI003569966A
MSISGALSSAMQGLRAAGRGSEVIAANLSNVLTPGYGVRSLELSSDTTATHGGVKIDGVSRLVNESIVHDKRIAEAGQANASAVLDLYIKVEDLLGAPDDPASLSAQTAQLEKNLITAASRPDAPERLSTVVSSARILANTFKEASDGLQSIRTTADRTIGLQVDQLNAALSQVQELNAQITKTQVQGNNSSGLLDQRQRVIDEISVLVPVRTVARDNGQVAIYSTGGAVLLDSLAAEVGFERSNLVTPYMSESAGTLSGLTINGIVFRTGSTNGVLSGGSIAAQFEIRDEIAVEAQAQIDALARNLVERFQDPAVDPSLAIGDAGLFTDEGNFFDPANEIGLAQRLVLNAAIDPDQGGQAWRLRDGIGATTTGDVGDATLINNMISALSSGHISSSGLFSGGAYSTIDLTSTLASHYGAERLNAEQTLSFSATQVTELTERLMSEGVDSDQEMQKLLLVEQAFAANARMIQAVDEMMQTLLRI